jgi:hypothetical protein
MKAVLLTNPILNTSSVHRERESERERETDRREEREKDLLELVQAKETKEIKVLSSWKLKRNRGAQNDCSTSTAEEGLLE